MPTLTALKEVRYGGATVRAGETFEATEKDARLLKAIGQASDGEAKNPTDLPKYEPVDPRRASMDDTHRPIVPSSLASLRAEYKSVVGKLPGPRWDEETIRARMNSYRTGALTAGE
jgi:hypothetical protein